MRPNDPLKDKSESKKLLFLGTYEDIAYMSELKSMVGMAKVFVLNKEISTIIEIVQHCKQREITGCFSTNLSLLKKLVLAKGGSNKTPSISNYEGSYFEYEGIEFVFIEPLAQLVTVPYAQFVTQRMISKLVYPELWLEMPPFEWEIFTPTRAELIFETMQLATVIALDIETVQENLAIVCVGYTALFIGVENNISTYSVVIPCDSEYNLAWIKKFNAELEPAKVMQNGKYDILYCARYNAPVYNYLWDTANCFHSWYAELPKDLAFLGAFFIRKAMYWKDLANTSDLHEYYKYNALDTYTTVLILFAWILQAPQWAKQNYLMEFPVVFPSHMCELIGIKRDIPRLQIAYKELTESIEFANKSLSTMLGVWPQIFNVNSTPQMAKLRTIFGCKDMTSSDETHLKKMGLRHPLNQRIVSKILELRGERKLISTYLTEGKELNGRILYSINPHGTDTGRNSSNESAFWCGLQIQNIPRGPKVKQTLVADDGFVFAECDLQQAESWNTAYASGDRALISAVSGDRDFHATNASAFFGVPYEEIYDDATGKTKDKKLRDLSKRVNHGANYLMGAGVLIDTMGEDKIWEAKRLLKLPKLFGLLDVASYLLDQFHRTYPGLASRYYPYVVAEVVKTKMLVGAQGWTRFCFKHPVKNKRDKNAYVAHKSQSENAMTLNKAFLRVFYDIAIHPEHSKNFKLIAQIHDSILFQFRVGHNYLCEMVRIRMQISVTVKGADGVVRTFTVPADIKAGKDGQGVKYWSDTE